MSFTDPVVRCTECQLMVTREEVQKHGCCPGCGNRRMRNVLNMSSEERTRLRGMGCEDFLALFEEVSECPVS
jgi:hypothetical protein